MGSVESGRLGLDFGGFQGLKFRAKAKKESVGVVGLGTRTKRKRGEK